uniref:Uncharacterized protein n=1 Tax=Anguilla anguilla TaxID=7936 RepID=A0A0E9S934_ANGAN
MHRPALWCSRPFTQIITITGAAVTMTHSPRSTRDPDCTWKANMGR